MEPVKRKEDGGSCCRRDQARRDMAGTKVFQDIQKACFCLEREITVDAGVVTALCKELL